MPRANVSVSSSWPNTMHTGRCFLSSPTSAHPAAAPTPREVQRRVRAGAQAPREAARARPRRNRCRTEGCLRYRIGCVHLPACSDPGTSRVATRRGRALRGAFGYFGAHGGIAGERCRSPRTDLGDGPRRRSWPRTRWSRAVSTGSTSSCPVALPAGADRRCDRRGRSGWQPSVEYARPSPSVG